MVAGVRLSRGRASFEPRLRACRYSQVALALTSASVFVHRRRRRGAASRIRRRRDRAEAASNANLSATDRTQRATRACTAETTPRRVTEAACPVGRGSRAAVAIVGPIRESFIASTLDLLAATCGRVRDSQSRAVLSP